VLNLTPTAVAGGVQNFYKFWGTKTVGVGKQMPSVQQPHQILPCCIMIFIQAPKVEWALLQLLLLYKKIVS
jgi:hypothetical protein